MTNNGKRKLLIIALSVVSALALTLGAYGAQDKDGAATVGAKEQIGLTVMEIMEGIE